MIFAPTIFDLTNLIVGQTLSESFTLYTDDTKTVVFDLTGSTVTVTLKPPGPNSTPIVLSLGSGVTIPTPTSGIVNFSAPTSSWETGRGRWYMQVTDAQGNVSFPYRGSMFIGNP